MAVASLVLGIVGGFFCFLWLLAIIFGFVARTQIDRSNGAQKGRGMATAGIVLGFVWFTLLVIWIGVLAGSS
jgi:Domain of unknown function (DUF4190)